MPNQSVLNPPTLIGNQIELRLLQPEHREAMLSAAADGELWNLKVTAVPSASTIDSYIATAVAARDAGSMLPFVIVQQDSGRIIGSTRFWKIDRGNRKMEIGHTWLSQSVQRTGVNTEAKYLLLGYAF
ncbi:GNAT family N-acetyltransferase [Serratia fonticola]